MIESIAAFLRNPQPRVLRRVCAFVFGAGLVLLATAYVLLERNLDLQAANTRQASEHVHREVMALHVIQSAVVYGKNRGAPERTQLLRAIHDLEVSVHEMPAAKRIRDLFRRESAAAAREAAAWMRPAEEFLGLARSIAQDPNAESIRRLQTQAHAPLVDALHAAELRFFEENRQQIRSLTFAKYIVLIAIFGLSLGEALLVVRPLTRALDRAEERMRQLAEEDGLTGLATRGVFLERAAAAGVDSKLRGEAMSLLLFDLDRLRSVNHCFGAGGGNAAIAHIAALVREAAPSTAIAARWDGDEIILLLPEGSLNEAIRFAETLRRQIAETLCLVDRHQPVYVTASIGLARFDPATESLTEAILRADGNLRRAKLSGRNRVMFGLEDAATALAA